MKASGYEPAASNHRYRQGRSDFGGIEKLATDLGRNRLDRKLQDDGAIWQIAGRMALVGRDKRERSVFLFSIIPRNNSH